MIQTAPMPTANAVGRFHFGCGAGGFGCTRSPAPETEQRALQEEADERKERVERQEPLGADELEHQMISTSAYLRRKLNCELATPIATLIENTCGTLVSNEALPLLANT